jgi:hypothetical protein
MMMQTEAIATITLTIYQTVFGSSEINQNNGKLIRTDCGFGYLISVFVSPFIGGIAFP